MTCPDKHILAAWLAGDVEVQRRDALETHVGQCEHCRQILRTLKKENQLAHQLCEAVGGKSTHDLRERLRSVLGETYELWEEIGRGARGSVFKAHDKRLDKIVAVKCLTQVEQQRRWWETLNEARAMGKVDHPNIVSILAIYDQGDPPFLLMEYVDGCPVTQGAEALSLQQIQEAFLQILQGVAALHHNGIVHRDLKPSNILIDRTGRIKILDFGIADRSCWDSGPTFPWSEVQGTPLYLPPEQAQGAAPKPSMDVFALGVVLYELLTGQRPFKGESFEQTLTCMQQESPLLLRELRSDIPAPLQAICLTALEKEPDRRYHSAQEFLLDFERYLRGEPIVADPSALCGALEHGVQRHLTDMDRWQRDRLISRREYDAFNDRYELLLQREASWVLDSRRLSFSQVLLHLGAWMCVLSIFPILCFQWENLGSTARIGFPLVLFTLLGGTGVYFWRRQTKRIGVVLLIATSMTLFSLIATICITLEWAHVDLLRPEGLDPGQDAATALLPEFMFNLQFFWSSVGWMLLNMFLWRQTRTTAFALLSSVSFLAAVTGWFCLMGMIPYWAEGVYERVAGWYLAPGCALLGCALFLDYRHRAVHMVTPLYVSAIGVLLGAVTLIALFGPSATWLGVSLGLKSGDEIRYSFMFNGLLYLGIGSLMDRSQRSRHLRRIATLLFWLTPSHLLLPMYLFAAETDATSWNSIPLWSGWETALTGTSLFFIFASVLKQMKSFFFSGLFYLALSAIHLTIRYYDNQMLWPLTLVGCGLVLMVLAGRYPKLFDKRKTGQ